MKPLYNHMAVLELIQSQKEKQDPVHSENFL